MPIPMYNNYGYYPQYQQGAQMSLPNQQQPMQIQNGGLISVRNEMEARNYPIASGTSITFKDENSPYVYTKTMGFSQLDRPTFEKFRLVKEDISEAQIQPQTVNPINLSSYVEKAEFEAFKSEFEAFRKEVTNEQRNRHSASGSSKKSNAISGSEKIQRATGYNE